jgi:hypothetical protein
MGVLVTFTVGLMIWIALFAFGVKPFDAFLIPLFLLVIAATVHIARPYLERMIKP